MKLDNIAEEIDDDHMDVLGALFLMFFIFCIMMCCGWCCKSKRRGAVLSTPVVVTSTTHTTPGGYTVTQIPANATGYQHSNVYVAPYPTQNVPTQMPMPMPMNVGAQPAPPPGLYGYGAPYPPASNANPPSYDMVVGGAASGQANNAAAYEKPAPYNPNYAPQ